ncbi:M48 family metalloprotease [Streptosporangium sp. NPDC000396]|uniref:M48 family metalloprotease n=1 Tax=Streptosporangium sp. NPDC000396 TaxID=3366185 RepID=UPI00369EF363
MGTARLDSAGMTPGPVNPFLLPAATSSRFILLIAITLSAAGSSYDLVAGGPSGWREAYLRCDRAADADALRLPAEPLAQRYLSCLDEIGLSRGLAGAGAMLLVALAIVGLYAIRPRLTIRRQHLVPADPAAYAGLHETVRRLAESEGLRRVPQIMLDVHRKTPDGRAFGRYPRYYLRLNIGVLQRERESPGDKTVESVVLHELAHLRNRDVDLTNLTLASAWAFGGVVAAPLLLFTLVRDPARLPDVGIRTTASMALVMVLAAAVLRSREHYADVRASVAGGRLIPRPPRRGGWIRALLPMHPRDTRRAKVVRDPGILMRWVPGEALGAGVAAGLGLSHFWEITRLWSANNTRYALLLTSLPYGLLAVTVVGAGAYRATLSALVAAGPVPRGVVSGAALAAGIVLGLLISPSNLNVSWAEAMAGAPGVTAGMAAALLVMCVALTRGLAVAAAAWLPVARGRTLLPVLLGGLVPAALAFGLWLGAWTAAANIALELGDLLRGFYGLFGQLVDAALLTALWVAVLHPLGSWFRHGSPGRGRNVYLAADGVIVLPAARVRPVLALAPAALILVIGTAGDLLLPERALFTLLIETGKWSSGDRFDVLLVQVAALAAVTALAQVTAAVVSAIVAGRGGAVLGPAHGMLAALAGGIAAIAVLIGPVLPGLCGPAAPGCDVPALASWVGVALLVVTAFGTPLSAAMIGLVSGVRGLVRLFGRGGARRDHPARPAGPWARRLSTLAAAVFVLLWMAVMTPVWLAEQGFARGPGAVAASSSASAVPPPGRPGTRTVQSACAEAIVAVTAPLLGDNYHVNWARAFAHLAETENAFLATLGRAGYPSARDALADDYRDLQPLIIQYCGRVPRS